ncbi:hypothetical protein Tco_0924191 [Tanacetum coccineum]|uniref:Uncharacterized protein n=1 Tax=Tanacetum coccineum TaxID=301880 RepID=A0ABQ5D4L8_9ASTR
MFISLTMRLLNTNSWSDGPRMKKRAKRWREEFEWKRSLCEIDFMFGINAFDLDKGTGIMNDKSCHFASSGLPTLLSTPCLCKAEFLLGSRMRRLSDRVDPEEYVDDVVEDGPVRTILGWGEDGDDDDVEARRQGIREVGYGIRDTWVDSAEAVPEIAPMTRMLRMVGLYITAGRTGLASGSDYTMGDRVTIRRQYSLLMEEEAYTSREAWAHSVGLSQAVHYELQTHREQVHKTRSQMLQTEMVELRETDCRRKVQMVEILRVMIDMRREIGDMQAELLALREQQRRARQTEPDVRVPDHQDASRDTDSHI